MRRAQGATLDAAALCFDRKKPDRGYAYVAASRVRFLSCLFHIGKLRCSDWLPVGGDPRGNEQVELGDESDSTNSSQHGCNDDEDEHEESEEEMQGESDSEVSEEDIDNMDEEDDPFMSLAKHVHNDSVDQENVCLFDNDGASGEEDGDGDPFQNLGLHMHRDFNEQQHECLFVDASDGDQ
jgi:hypothetical protein